MTIQEEINSKLLKLSEAEDFKVYFKVQREIFNEYVGTFRYVEDFLERDALKEYISLVQSFGERAGVEKENGRNDKKKFEVIEKFDKQVRELLLKKDYQKVSEQLFYVLLGNVLEHIGKGGADMKDFDLSKDLYPSLKFPLGLAFFLFQDLVFGKIATQVNTLSKEYLEKYIALVLGLWRTIFELMIYEKQVLKAEAEKKEKQAESQKTAS